MNLHFTYIFLLPESRPRCSPNRKKKKDETEKQGEAKKGGGAAEEDRPNRAHLGNQEALGGFEQHQDRVPWPSAAEVAFNVAASCADELSGDLRSKCRCLLACPLRYVVRAPCVMLHKRILSPGRIAQD
jgi:hypothetical protein